MLCGFLLFFVCFCFLFLFVLFVFLGFFFCLWVGGGVGGGGGGVYLGVWTCILGVPGRAIQDSGGTEAFPRWVQNTPTGCGNNSPTRQTPFWEISCLMICLVFFSRTILIFGRGHFLHVFAKLMVPN